MARQEKDKSGKKAGGAGRVFAVIGKVVVDLPDGVSDGSDLCMPVCSLCEKRSVPAGGVGFRQLLHGADLSYLL